MLCNAMTTQFTVPSRADPAYQGVNSVVNWVATCRRLLNVGISYTQRSSSVQGSQVHAIRRMSNSLALVSSCPNGLQHITSRAYIMLGPPSMQYMTTCCNAFFQSVSQHSVVKENRGLLCTQRNEEIATCATVFEPG